MVRPSLRESSRMDQISPKMLTVLVWWRDVGQTRFPRIAVMTRQFLTFPEASVTVERVFSFTGLTLSDHRPRTPKSTDQGPQIHFFLPFSSFTGQKPTSSHLTGNHDANQKNKKKPSSSKKS